MVRSEVDVGVFKMKSSGYRSFATWVFGVATGLGLVVSHSVLADKDNDVSPGVNSLPWEDARLLAEVLERV